MKTTFKKYIHTSLAVVLVGAFVFGLASPALAYEDLARTSRASEEAFCKNISSLSSVTDEISAAAKRYEQSANARLKVLNEIRADRDRARFDARNERDKNRLEHFAKIEARAETPLEKAAISVFVKAVNVAINVRKAAYDAAVNAFRSGVNEAIKKRNTSFEQAIAALKKSVSVATDEANKDCRNDADAKTVRSAYLSQIRDARTAFQDATAALESVASSVEKLSEERDETISKAEEDFIDSIDAAITDLKKSFPGA